VQEAQAGQSRADFISKYSIALKEARETLYWLRLLDASGELSNGSCKILLKEADEIARIIASIIVSAKKGRGSWVVIYLFTFAFCLHSAVVLAGGRRWWVACS
jgi:23S rRNA-intervening sequence protein